MESRAESTPQADRVETKGRAIGDTRKSSRLNRATQTTGPSV